MPGTGGARLRCVLARPGSALDGPACHASHGPALIQVGRVKLRQYLIQIKAKRPFGTNLPRMEISALIAKYDRRVPRYTSYPTAPHFSAAVTAADYAGWLRTLPDDTALSLYLHVPFCASLCLFCACHTTVVHRPEPLARLRRDPAGRNRPGGRRRSAGA